MIKFSLLGETILEWNDKDIEHYHARRMAYSCIACQDSDRLADRNKPVCKSLVII